MDEVLYNFLKEAYLRASEIGETEIAKSIYQSFTITLIGGNEMMTKTITL